MCKIWWVLWIFRYNPMSGHRQSAYKFCSSARLSILLPNSFRPVCRQSDYSSTWLWEVGKHPGRCQLFRFCLGIWQGPAKISCETVKALFGRYWYSQDSRTLYGQILASITEWISRSLQALSRLHWQICRHSLIERASGSEVEEESLKAKEKYSKCLPADVRSRNEFFK